MRKIVFGCANSLDNFIARENNALDWLRWSDEAAAIVGEMFERFDAILMGRKTYLAGLATRGGKNPYPNVKTFVFSRTLPPSDDENVKIVLGDAIEFVRGLKSLPGKDICCMGGGEFAKCLFEADLIDEVGVNIHPILLGAGAPLFLAMSKQIDLKLIESKTLKNDCVYLRYCVER